MRQFLVVVDMQKDFVDGALGTKEARAIIPAAVEKIRSWDGELFVTYDTHFEDYLDTAEGKLISLIIYGRSRALGLMGRDDDVVIRCGDIRLIGEDTILVDISDTAKPSNEPRYKVDNLLKTEK